MHRKTIQVKHFDALRTALNTHARREPWDVAYQLDLDVNGVRYRLRLLLDGRALCPYQAVKLHPDAGRWELITRPALLGALTELAVEQYIAGMA